MQVKHLFITITVLFGLLLPSLSHAQKNRPINLPDASLRAKIAQTLGKRSNAQITPVDMLALTELDAPNANIRNLTGIEQAHNLYLLDLGSEYIDGEGYVNSNRVSDFSPLQGLTQLIDLDLSLSSLSDVSFLSNMPQLTRLDLSDNTLSDISALAGLTQLTSLSLSGNSPSDISALAGLTQLTSLYLWNNSVSDISALAGLTQLTSLYLGHNSVSDISALAGLTQLTSLSLWDNSVSDISALAGLTQLTSLYLGHNSVSDISALAGLTQLTHLYLERNPLNYASINRHIPAMQTKGIEIRFDPRTPMTLRKYFGDAQQGAVSETLPLPFVVEVLDQEGHAFAGVPVKFNITEGRGQLSATKTTTDVRGKAEAYLTLRPAPGTNIVRVTAAKISQPVQFTATAARPNSPVAIPDANLRAKIAETLGKPLGEMFTLTDMSKLRTLTANNADILDLTGLQHAANLTTLSLTNNNLSDIAPLAGLTQLTTLDLRNNRILDVSPLVGLAQLKGSKNRHGLYLQGNPLSDTAIRVHIPMLQAAGVNVRFDSMLTQSRPIVRLVYFLPRDRQPQPDIDAKMDRLIKDVQQFYTEQMDTHGFGGKTFQFETDPQGNAVVYHINGKFDDTHYHDVSGVVWEEIDEQFDRSRNIYLTALDISTENIGVGEGETFCGTGDGGSHSGGALIPASGGCFNIRVAAHELGHAFGLQHDFRSDSYLMSYGGPRRGELSQCAAEWLDVHRSFNASQTASNSRATIGMLPPKLVSPPYDIRFRFKVNAPEGIHQVQLHTKTLSGAAEGFLELVACKRLNRNLSSTVNFLTTSLGTANKSVSLQVIDVHGNFSVSEAFPVDIFALLPRPEAVSIPDPNLAAAVRQEIGNKITTHTLLNLTRLEVPDRKITNLAGLEYAHNLTDLNLDNNNISDVSPLIRVRAGIGTQQIRVSIRRNPLSYTSVNTHIPAMQANNIHVEHDGIAHPELLKISGDTQDSTVGEPLPKPFVVKAINIYGKPMQGVFVTFAITTSGGRLSAKTAITDATGKAQTTLMLGQTPGKHTVHGSATGIQNSVTFTATATEPPIYWIKKNNGTLHRSQGTTVKNLVPSAQNATSLAVDVASNKLYWMQQTSNTTGKIQRADLDGSNVQLVKVLTSVPRGLTVDLINRKLYLTNAWGKVQRLNFDGSNFQANLITGLDSPKSIALDVTRGKLYWTEQTSNTTGKIQRANLDGSNVQLVTELTSVPRGLAVDTTNGKLYLTNAWGKIQRLNLNGSNFEPNFITGLDSPEGIVVDIAGGKLYWTETNGIKCGDLNGENVQEVVAGLGAPTSIALSIVPVEPVIAAAPAGLTVLPTATGLLPNYPNPFNPETWIPYQLTTPSEVTLYIYTVNGTLIRTLALGLQPAGIYHGKSRAVYWDGRNEQGERVASGIYFYTLSAGDFTATRKMLIKK